MVRSQSYGSHLVFVFFIFTLVSTDHSGGYTVERPKNSVYRHIKSIIVCRLVVIDVSPVRFPSHIRSIRKTGASFKKGSAILEDSDRHNTFESTCALCSSPRFREKVHLHTHIIINNFSSHSDFTHPLHILHTVDSSSCILLS